MSGNAFNDKMHDMYGKDYKDWVLGAVRTENNFDRNLLYGSPHCVAESQMARRRADKGEMEKLMPYEQHSYTK